MPHTAHKKNHRLNSESQNKNTNFVKKDKSKESVYWIYFIGFLAISLVLLFIFK